MALSSIGSFDPRYITEAKLVHPENAEDSIDVTEDGMVIDVDSCSYKKHCFLLM